jgi:predicted RNA-binding Zn ribbon-like protein
MILMKLINHRWIARDIVAGNFALNLVNTVSGWNDDPPEDWIPDIASYIAWARTSGIFSTEEEKEAARLAKSSAVTAARVLAALKELRFALWRLVDCLENRRPTDPTDLWVLNEWRANLALSEQVMVRSNKIAFAIYSDVSVLELPALRVTRSALSLLTEWPYGRIKTCPGANCGWKFVDQSKNRSRRWCDMKVCGNLAKANEYRARKR